MAGNVRERNATRGGYMLRIHFTRTDLARTQVAHGPDSLWETVLSLQMLRARYGRLPFAEWRHRVRGDLSRRARPEVVRQLFSLTPDASYFPDFLTPPEALLGVGDGIEAVVATPPARISYELGILHERVGAPAWARELCERSSAPRRRLGRMLSDYHRIALTPHWPAVRRAVELDRAIRIRALQTGGPEALLESFRPGMRWRPPVLEVPGYPIRRELHLQGRGLLLIPSRFCWKRPTALAAPELPPTLLYPLARDPQWMRAEPAAEPDTGHGLARLLGGTRAAVLEAAAATLNTGDLARVLGVSPTAVSQHTAVLREAGLLTSSRHANSVFHRPTSLGTALLDRGGG